MGTLVMMHFPSDTAFALRALERIFFGAFAPASSAMSRSTSRSGSRTWRKGRSGKPRPTALQG